MSLQWQVRLLIVAQFILIACLDMSDPYWPLIVQAANPTLTPQALQFWSASIYMLPFLITLVMTPVWSHWGQFVGQKKMLLRAGIALVVTQGAVFFVNDPAWILVVRTIQGFFAGYSAAAQVWSVNIAPAKWHNAIVAKLQAATALGTIVGPVAGGVIAESFGYPAIFIISASILLMLTLLLASQLQEIVVKAVSSLPASRHLFWRTLSWQVVFLLGLICYSQAARWMSSPFFSLYVAERFGGSSMQVGLVYSIVALVMFVSASWWPKLIEKYSKQAHALNRFFIIILLLAFVSQQLFAYATDFRVVLLAALLWGVCLGAISLLPFTLLMRSVENTEVGKIIGLGHSASKLGNLLGVACGAFIQAEGSFTLSFIVISLLYLFLSGVLCLPYPKQFLASHPSC